MKRVSLVGSILLMWVWGCKPTVREDTSTSKPVHVKAVSVEMAHYSIPVRATGMLTTTTQMKLSFKTGGIIQHIHVREGISVKRGEVLATLDLSEIRAQVQQAKIGLEKAERDLNRARNLYQDSVATLEQYQNARSAFELARAQKQIADFNLEHSRIKAPSEGKILKVLVEANEVIGPGYPAVLFGSTENDWVVRTALTDKDIVKLSLGDSARVTMDAFPGMEFRAEITELGNAADPVTGTYEAELLILQSLPQFRTGFISRAELFPSHVNQSLVVPVEALLDASDDRAYVFVYQQNKAIRRHLVIGDIVGDRVVVRNGLDEGELVITEGAKYVRTDTEVHLVIPSDTIVP
jgi:RND family efflux transporter MFP subunit